MRSRPTPSLVTRAAGTPFASRSTCSPPTPHPRLHFLHSARPHQPPILHPPPTLYPHICKSVLCVQVQKRLCSIIAAVSRRRKRRADGGERCHHHVRPPPDELRAIPHLAQASVRSRRAAHVPPPLRISYPVQSCTHAHAFVALSSYCPRLTRCSYSITVFAGAHRGLEVTGSNQLTAVRIPACRSAPFTSRCLHSLSRAVQVRPTAEASITVYQVNCGCQAARAMQSLLPPPSSLLPCNRSLFTAP